VGKGLNHSPHHCNFESITKKEGTNMSEDLQTPAQDTPGKPAETVAGQGTVDTKVDTTKVETPEMVSKSDFEELRRQHEHSEKRKNQLEKLLKDATENPDSSKKDEIIANLTTQLEAIQEEQQQEEQQRAIATYTKEMDNLFDTKLAGYPEAVKKAAQFNKEKFGVLNIVGDVQYAYEAEKKITSFLDELSEQFGESQPEIRVDSTNPQIQATSDQDLVETAKQTGNWIPVIRARKGKK